VGRRREERASEQGREGGLREEVSVGDGEEARREKMWGRDRRGWKHLMSSDVSGDGVAASSAASRAAPPAPSLRPRSTVRVLTAAAAALVRYTPPIISTFVRKGGREGEGDGRGGG
jgi:hypothetical protein